MRLLFRVQERHLAGKSGRHFWADGAPGGREIRDSHTVQTNNRDGELGPSVGQRARNDQPRPKAHLERCQSSLPEEEIQERGEKCDGLHRKADSQQPEQRTVVGDTRP